MKIITSLLIATVLSAMPESVYVTSDDVKIYTDSSLSSEVVTLVDTNEMLTVVEQVGDFYLVKTENDDKGFVSLEDVSEESAEEDLGGLMDLLGDGDRTASVEEGSSSHSIRGRTAHMDEDSSSHSIRGLKGSEGANAGLSEQEAEGSVSSMEKFAISNGELEKFQQVGSVGDYAK